MKLPDEPTPLQRLIEIVTDMSDEDLIKARRDATEASVEGELPNAKLLIAVIDFVREGREQWYQEIGWRPGDPPMAARSAWEVADDDVVIQ